MGNCGKPELIEALRLKEIFPEPNFVAVTTDALRLGAISYSLGWLTSMGADDS
jgi:hypothetical protein